MKRLTYADSGVDIRAEERAISAMKRVMTGRRKGIGAPITDIGHYAGLIDMGEYALAMTTDGVGSKVLIANAMKKWDTVGIDCMAMNVNDLLAIGAEPLAFVDYLALERIDPEMTAAIAIGLERGAQIANLSIVGGETASLPEIIRGFDLAGTCIGMIKKEEVITGEKIKKGDVVVGLPSSGLHSNGFSLARKIVAESSYTYFDKMPGSEKTIGELLLEPTRIYMEALEVIRKADVHGMAHITGSGLLKLHRISGFGFEIFDPLEPQPIFRFLQEEGGVAEDEMYRTFNMGMGWVFVLPEDDADTVLKMTDGKVVGEIVDEGLRLGDMELK
ncbi:phosphoribosylformylglycinamidine cyclo-ligase [Methanotrichaceae archaeon M04Ac]|jgi:phosphoribosylformylglycinamidine cyclo-ligase|uniref:Phosphoribosylformylglycinamidine cyclo-ligase n=1 Tax=Candidatus Methanocrinis alkalitolerans TaxID=3033395 RepID=A0ABT5XCI4_9EURY|nr:phosphoribosylformylglycinamidine cyclo-ligase [Candidatus Methanocrinis alkalitolerans]MDF0592375.1 phosphoribosylformylglycinamidine cyclo-ligase [Candidatus Methanocrinis alkalitolerans]